MCAAAVAILEAAFVRILMAALAIVRSARVAGTVGIGIPLRIRTVRRMARLACNSRMDAVQGKARLGMGPDISTALTLRPLQVCCEMAGLALSVPLCPMWTCMAANAVLRQAEIGRGACLARKSRQRKRDCELVAMAGGAGQTLVMARELEINVGMIEGRQALTLPGQVADEGKIPAVMLRVTWLTGAGSLEEKIAVIALDVIELFGDFTVARQTAMRQSLLGVALTA